MLVPKCPRCGRSVEVTDSVCRWCGADTRTGRLPQVRRERTTTLYEPEKDENRGAKIALVVILLLAIAGFVAWKFFLQTDESKIRSTVSSFEKAAKAGDYAGVLRCYDEDSQLAMKLLWVRRYGSAPAVNDNLVKEAGVHYVGADDGGRLSELLGIGVTDVRVEDGTAVVQVTVSRRLDGVAESEDDALVLRSDGGGWRLDLYDEVRKRLGVDVRGNREQYEKLIRDLKKAPVSANAPREPTPEEEAARKKELEEQQAAEAQERKQLEEEGAVEAVKTLERLRKAIVKQDREAFRDCYDPARHTVREIDGFFDGSVENIETFRGMKVGSAEANWDAPGGLNEEYDAVMDVHVTLPSDTGHTNESVILVVKSGDSWYIA